MSSHSPKTNTSTEPMATVVKSKGNVKSGFSVGDANLSLSPHTKISSPAQIPSYSTGSSHSSANKGSLDGKLPSGEHSVGMQYDVSTGYFGSSADDRDNVGSPCSPNMASSPRGYSSPQRSASSQQRRSSEDILYPFDSVDLEGSRTSPFAGKEAGNTGQDNAKSRLTSSEPIASTQSIVQAVTSSPAKVDESRRHSSAVEEQMKPWNLPKRSKSLNPFDQEYKSVKLFSQKSGKGSIPESQVGEYSFQVPEERYGATAMLAKHQRKEFKEQVIEEQHDVTAASRMDSEERNMEKQKQYGIVTSQLEPVDEQPAPRSVREDGCEEGWSEPNPFDEGRSTNPFDFEPDLSMEVEGDIGRRREGEEMWLEPGMYVHLNCEGWERWRDGG